MTSELTKPIRWRRLALRLIAAIILLPGVLTLLFAVAPVPITPLMILRAIDGAPIDKQWVPLEKIALHLQRSVIAAEDATFCSHHGFEFEAMKKAWDGYQRGERLRGGSTITMQTAKNVYLWPGRTLFRKGLEAWLTLYLDALWSKQRTLEVYLNIVEWAPGVYGAEAAAQYHFRKSATALSADEAALLASVLPSPRRWSASKPGPYVRTRAQTIAYRATQMGDGSSCLAKK